MAAELDPILDRWLVEGANQGAPGAKEPTAGAGANNTSAETRLAAAGSSDGGGGFTVNGQAIKDLADASDRLLAELLKFGFSTRQSTDTAAKALDGWETGRQLSQTINTWENQVRALQNRMIASAGLLDQTAENYRWSDEEAAGLFGTPG